MKASLYVPPAVLLSLGLAIHAPQLKAIDAKLDDRAEYNERIAQHSRQSRTEGREKDLESQEALRIYQSGCIPVVDKKTGKEMRMMENQLVEVGEGVSVPINDGVYICNSLGDTAKVVDGMPIKVYRINAKNEAESCPYRTAIAQQQEANSVWVKALCEQAYPSKTLEGGIR